MNNNPIITQAVTLAQQHAQGRIWQKGDIACHPKEPITCEIREFDGNGLVTIGWEEIEWTVPLDEIFDPNKAQTIALNLSR